MWNTKWLRIDYMRIDWLIEPSSTCCVRVSWWELLSLSLLLGSRCIFKFSLVFPCWAGRETFQRCFNAGVPVLQCFSVSVFRCFSGPADRKRGETRHGNEVEARAGFEHFNFQAFSFHFSFLSFPRYARSVLLASQSQSSFAASFFHHAACQRLKPKISQLHLSLCKSVNRTTKNISFILTPIDCIDHR